MFTNKQSLNPLRPLFCWHKTGRRVLPLGFMLYSAFFNYSCFDNLIFSSTSSSRIDYSPSDDHSSYDSTIVPYINISWLKHESFLSSPRWSDWPPPSYLSVWHFLVLVHLLCLLSCLLLVE